MTQASTIARPVRVLAVDHNRILREGIGALIGSESDLELIGSAATSDAAVSLFADTRPDLTLVDLDMPGLGGIDMISRIHQIDPAAWVIGLITDERDRVCSDAIHAGASSLLAKDLIGRMLVPMIYSGIHSGRDRPIL